MKQELPAHVTVVSVHRDTTNIKSAVIADESHYEETDHSEEQKMIHVCSLNLLSGEELLKTWNEPENIKHLAKWQKEPVFLMAELCSTGGATEQHSSQQYMFILCSCPPGMFLLLSCNYNVHSTNFDHNAIDMLSNFTFLSAFHAY